MGEFHRLSCDPWDLRPPWTRIATALALMQSRTNVMPWYRLVGLWIPGRSTGATWVTAHSRHGRSRKRGLTSPLFVRSQARLTKTVKVSHRVAEAHAGSDRRFLPSHTRVSLFCGRMQEGWVLIRQHSGSLSTGSSVGRLFRRRLNVQSGHREVRRARREMHQAMPREKGNTEKVGMVTCCQESRGRRLSTQCYLLDADWDQVHR